MKIIIFTILIIALFLISCEKGETTHYPVDEELQKYIPFEGGEKIHFMVNSTEQMILTAQNKRTETTEFEISNDRNIYDIITLSLINSNNGIVFNISVSHDSRNFPLYVVSEPHLQKSSVYNYNVLSHPNYTMLSSVNVRNRTYNDVMLTETESGSAYYSVEDGIIKIVNIDYVENDTTIFELDSIVWY